MAKIYPELKKVVKELIEDGIIPKKYRGRVLNEVSEAFRQQMRIRYTYLVGEWRGRVRSKSAKTGGLVSNKIVVRYINQNG